MPKTMSGIRIRYFGPCKEMFHLEGWHILWTEARDQAEILRNGGFNARITKTVKGYEVWASRWVRGAAKLQYTL